MRRTFLVVTVPFLLSRNAWGQAQSLSASDRLLQIQPS
jgi:hypothetical protein